MQIVKKWNYASKSNTLRCKQPSLNETWNTFSLLLGRWHIVGIFLKYAMLLLMEGPSHIGTLRCRAVIMARLISFHTPPTTIQSKNMLVSISISTHHTIPSRAVGKLTWCYTQREKSIWGTFSVFCQIGNQINLLSPHAAALVAINWWLLANVFLSIRWNKWLICFLIRQTKIPLPSWPSS